MSDLHIDDFYRDVETIFLRLYAVFPRKTILYVEDICGPDQPDEFGLHHPRFQAGFSAMVWLAEEGYLNFQDTIRAEAHLMKTLFHRASLNSPGQISTSCATFCARVPAFACKNVWPLCWHKTRSAGADFQRIALRIGYRYD